MTLIGTTKFLVRFSEIKWLQGTKNGTLRFTPLTRYRSREIQDDPERFDAFEGASRIDQPNSIRRVTLSFRDLRTGAPLIGTDGASFCGIEHKIVGPILWFDPSEFSHVLCLSIHEQELRSDDISMDLKEKADGFGSSTLIVHDIAEFAKRIGEFFDQQRIPFAYGPVEYVAADYGGEYGAFKKNPRA
jgi:hypothetical protein